LKKRSKHLGPLVGTIILFGCTAGGAYMFSVKIIPVWVLPIMIIASYILYLITGVIWNKTVTYLKNSKTFEDYQAVYYRMKSSHGYFLFFS
jgi:hypothetical protein